MSTRKVHALVLSVTKERKKRIMQRTIVHMEKGNMSAGRDVEVEVIVSMGRKGYCKDCDSRQLCKTPHCPSHKNPKYDGYCWYCFANLFPDKPVVRNYLTKETTVATFLKEKFPNVTWKCNKSVENGCSRRRPDLLLDMGIHIVIVEVDEHSHVGYDPTCEQKRLGEIWGNVFHRKIVFIRFNTDGYKDEDGNNVPSPWGLSKHALCIIIPKWKAA